MVDVKTIHFTFSREVDTGLPLDIKDHARGVEAGLLAGISDKPVRGRIGSDGGRQYFGLHRTGRGFIRGLRKITWTTHHQPIVARIYSIRRCLHHISAALRLRCTSFDSMRLGSFTSRTAFLPSSYSMRKSGTYRRWCFWPSIQGMVMPCRFIHLITCGSCSK